MCPVPDKVLKMFLFFILFHKKMADTFVPAIFFPLRL